MFKSRISNRLSILLLTALSSVLPFNAVNAVTFQETEVNQEGFIAIAQPYGENKYNLIVIEQIPNKDNCWNEITGSPVNVDLLLLNFDFSGHCRRSTDANGYSIRYDGQDYGLDFLLSLVKKDGNLLLMGTNRRNPRQAPIVVGSSEGLNGQPMKIKLNPGWRFTKRTYEGKVLGHVYFSYDSTSVAPVTNSNSERILESTSGKPTVPQGNIREIVAPNVEFQKQMKKSQKLYPRRQNTKYQFIQNQD